MNVIYDIGCVLYRHLVCLLPCFFVFYTSICLVNSNLDLYLGITQINYSSLVSQTKFCNILFPILKVISLEYEEYQLV
jgi:hypothetical protein